jgi:hypothetical protein
MTGSLRPAARFKRSRLAAWVACLAALGVIVGVVSAVALGSPTNSHRFRIPPQLNRVACDHCVWLGPVNHSAQARISKRLAAAHQGMTRRVYSATQSCPSSSGATTTRFELTSPPEGAVFASRVVRFTGNEGSSPVVVRLLQGGNQIDSLRFNCGVGTAFSGSVDIPSAMMGAMQLVAYDEANEGAVVSRNITVR